MGRASDLPNDTTAELHIRRVPLDGDYDPGGTYWGGGPGTLPLFCVFGIHDEEECVAYLRASDYEEAKRKFPNAKWAVETGPSESDIDDMLDGYITCALWSTNDESDESGGEPLDENYDETDLADETRATMRADVEKFARANAQVIAEAFRTGPRCDWSHAGHDLWLTRNHHGAGFWDGDWPKDVGEKLTKAAHAFGEVNLYVGDDGKIYA